MVVAIAIVLNLLLAGQLFAQANVMAASQCNTVPVWSPCDLVFESTAQDSAQAELRAEFRSPRHRTLLLRAFRDSGRFVIRFAPTEAGSWDYRLTSSLKRLDGQMGQITAAESDSRGFIRPANVHHFSTEALGANGSVAPHLWMSTALDRFSNMPRAEFDAAIAQRASEKFTHLRVILDPSSDLSDAAERIRAINAKGLTADIVFGSLPADTRALDRYLEDAIPRLAAFNITWAGLPAFENTPHARLLLKQAGERIQKLDPYDHPRTTLANTTSGALAGDGWMNLLSYGTTDAQIGSVEHQLYQLPALNTGIHTAADLWNATMNGQYPASGSGPYMKIWADFMAQSRYWELEPYFDVDGGRAIALEGVEYLVYIEKPGPLELTLENHSYDVLWMNPATGDTVKQKEYKGEHFTSEPPDRSHDWVLRVSREGRKESMKSYKFESRPVPVQELEQNPAKVPYEITAPQGEQVSLSAPPLFSLKAKRDTRATRSLLVEWTAEVVLEGDGYRVAGTGKEGTLQISKSITSKFPAVLSLRATFLNANGKIYTMDRAYRLVP